LGEKLREKFLEGDFRRDLKNKFFGFLTFVI
jgi:hypothetical protein